MAFLGNTDATNQVDGTNGCYLAEKVIPSENGTITAMSTVSAFLAITDTLHISFFLDNANRPGTLLATVSVSVATSGSPALRTITGGTYTFTAGLTYWIVVSSTNGDNSGFVNGYTDDGSHLGPTLWTNGLGVPVDNTNGWSTFQGVIGAYVTYTPAGGGGPSGPPQSRILGNPNSAAIMRAASW